MDLADRIALLDRVLREGSYRAADEAMLQADIATRLETEGWDHEREVILSPKDRIDFLVEGGIGIEVKIKGRMAEVWRQINRYASSPLVEAVVLFTTRSQLRVMPTILYNKPIRTLYQPLF